jgi:xylulokinase
MQAGSTLDEISVVGGGSRLDFWNELLAAALSRPLLRRSGGEIGAAFGAARLGRLAVTGEDPDFVCTAPDIEREFVPDPGLRELLHERRPRFTRLYRQLKPLFRELHS